ncbi:Integrase catalytic domain-containing protein [Forsythia ovata]|uniref:Integrase catalytic domain-containing protein n=1 Tax=Forsythia ovata TaxID=205694 RepID=A0ABD1T9D3_9LAMI
MVSGNGNEATSDGVNSGSLLVTLMVRVAIVVPPIVSHSVLPTLLPVSMKLGRNNYNFWNLQVLPTLRAFDLESFVIERQICTQKYIKAGIDNSGNIIKQINPDFLTWL